MKIKHSQIRALIKFAGIVVFSYSLYQKLKQIFLYGGTVGDKNLTEPLSMYVGEDVAEYKLVTASEIGYALEDSEGFQEDSCDCDECVEEFTEDSYQDNEEK